MTSVTRGAVRATLALVVTLSATGASFQCGTPGVALSRVDLATGEVRRIAKPPGVGLGHLAAGAGALWVTTDDGLVRIDRRTGDVSRVAGAISDFTASAHRVWAVDDLSQDVLELDGRGRQVARHDLGARDTCQRISPARG